MEREYKDSIYLREYNESLFKQDPIYTLKVASHYVHCSKNTLRASLQSKAISGICVNGCWLVRRSALNKYIGGL